MIYYRIILPSCNSASVQDSYYAIIQKTGFICKMYKNIVFDSTRAKNVSWSTYLITVINWCDILVTQWTF